MEERKHIFYVEFRKLNKHALQLFVYKCLKRIQIIYWPNIDQKKMYAQTNLENLDLMIRKIKWNLIKDTLQGSKYDIVNRCT